MNKIVEKTKKPLLCVLLVSYVLFIILAVCYFSDIYWLEEVNSDLFKRMQSANTMLLYSGIVGVCAFAVFAIVGSISRKNYYQSNLIFNSLGSVASIVVSVIALLQQIAILPDFNKILPELIDFTNVMQSSSASKITPSTNVIYLAIILAIFTAIVAVLVIVMTVLKYIETSKKLKAKAKQAEVVA